MKITAIVAMIAAVCLSFAHSHDSVAAASGHSDTQILARASVRSGLLSPVSVVRWLRSQRAVSSAAVGRDRQTISIHFRDGPRAAILGRSQRDVAVPGLRPLLRPGAPSAAPAAQAAVWEPFAAELGLGPHAGDIEVQQLQAAGFGVDQKYDTSVTVAQIATLSRFNVVYMHTHSGVSAAGDGIVASGEPVNGDPAVAPYLSDGSVIAVGVAGSPQQYYGITGAFITRHEGNFPAGSLLFLNGCALLRSTTFWQALHSRGAAALVSWDQNGAAKDDYLSAAAFFNVMGTGQSVSAAISTLRAAGYGTSSDSGIPATLGYVGDGSVTLQSSAAAGNVQTTPPLATDTPEPTATSTPQPVATATPTSTATSTPLPTSTATSMPVPTHPPVPALISLSGVVKPGAAQRISIGNLVPATSIQIRVIFPDGEVMQGHATSDPTGHSQFVFVQADSKLTRRSLTARVEVTATTASGSATMSVQYTIGYGEIDVVAQPRILPAGGKGAILVHTRAHTAVSVTLRATNGKEKRLRGTTGKLGWVKLHFKLLPSAHRTQSVRVLAVVRLHGKKVQASTTLAVE